MLKEIKADKIIIAGLCMSAGLQRVSSKIFCAELKIISP